MENPEAHLTLRILVNQDLGPVLGWVYSSPIIGFKARIHAGISSPTGDAILTNSMQFQG